MLRRSLLPSGRPSAPARRVSESLGIRNSPLKRVHSSKPHLDKAKAPPLPISLASGGFAGLISALTGVGGGIILIPALARFTKLPQQTINGTSLGAVVMSSGVGAYNYLQTNHCNWPLAMLTTVPAVIFSKIGVQTAQKMSSKKLSIVVGSAMLLSSPLIYVKNSDWLKKLRNHGNRNDLDLEFYTLDDSPIYSKEDTRPLYLSDLAERPFDALQANAKYLLAGVGAGFISGLCGLGGGILLTGYLTAASDLPQETVIGTSLLSIVPTAATSTFYNVKAKAIHVPTSVALGSALVVAVYGTSKYVTHQVPEDKLRAVLSGTLAAAAISMMRRAL